MQPGEKVDILVCEDHRRIDLYLSSYFDCSRSYISIGIDDGLIRVNGDKVKRSTPVRQGDLISVIFPEKEEFDITPQKIDFEIIYDTERYAVINKPAGLVVHPSPGNTSGTLVSGILYAFDIKDDMENFRPGIVHRLDKDTSGLLIIAKDTEARLTLAELFKQREVNKFYTAVALGNPKFEELLIDKPVGRDPANRERMSVLLEGGKEAISKVKVIEKFSKSFLAEVQIFTGRTHQIRVHMKHIRHPLIGDHVYGGSKNHLFHRQALHAGRLEFIDPFNNKKVSFHAAPPDDISLLIESLRSGSDI